MSNYIRKGCIGQRNLLRERCASRGVRFASVPVQEPTGGNPPQVTAETQSSVTEKLCLRPLTGGTYFVTVAELLPNTLAELSAACG
jgi:hypothetical protein